MAISASQKRIHRAALRLFAEKGSSAITVSELAEVSGVARGTIYNNGLRPDSLFEDIASQLSNEMNARVIKTLGAEEDAAKRISFGIRMYMRRAHEEPDWGRFLCKFAFSSKSLMGLWTGESSPLSDVQKGLDSARYNIEGKQIFAVMSMIAGTVLSSMFLVLEGFKTWREIGSESAELILRALGLDPAEAHHIANIELPNLKEV
ncbi:TetR/AcrR family transcriptional regulator [Acinetobacter sp. SwsAc6]|uniref:TetR/AcrR family transcriptional regulator n=1 Tax=Acinetobacter TaxID=469 RepID=UPI000EA344CA|nr:MULTISPECIES: TetR/AcrR family transcriptional regulator [Acinetobacter]NWK74289.1 TetR/AcrR family transcriptional regulator [Acinetobacter sp. SwsAc6]RKG49617.1 TetR/AcrR family transcriptional regulator [Acinetobacter cumulans]